MDVGSAPVRGARSPGARCAPPPCSPMRASIDRASCRLTIARNSTDDIAACWSTIRCTSVDSTVAPHHRRDRAHMYSGAPTRSRCRRWGWRPRRLHVTSPTMQRPCGVTHDRLGHVTAVPTGRERAPRARDHACPSPWNATTGKTLGPGTMQSCTGTRQPHRGWNAQQPLHSSGGAGCVVRDVLLSHAVSRAVPSALEGLTSGFGMEPGVPPPQ
jgi:hypothetical protein